MLPDPKLFPTFHAFGIPAKLCFKITVTFLILHIIFYEKKN